MNCKQFNTIKLEEVLQNLGHLPTKQNEKEAWYLNPFGTENNASFKINKNLNCWYLYSEGIGGNNTDFMIKYLKTSVKEVLEWVEKQNFSSFQQQSFQNLNLENLHKNYEILEIKNIQHSALLEYLNDRKVANQVKFIQEIHYRMNGKNYFGIGFKNDSGGYEIRNKFAKICLGKKDITTIKNDSKNVKIFEGFFDFLTFKNIEKYLEKEPSDYIILNSVSMIYKAQKSLEDYKNIELYFDNDEAGNRVVEILKKELNNVEDGRILYSGFKDLNEYLIQRTNEVQKQYKPRFKR
ncbi:toprim domain-containing protein [Cloacibacterium normanense]|uniref:toprim domain-containing protein n=1 Tax=Cloacibacterium normanense TaxID=237258 RepID=UPI00352E24FE